jgi:hypothetical protein
MGRMTAHFDNVSPDPDLYLAWGAPEQVKSGFVAAANKAQFDEAQDEQWQRGWRSYQLQREAADTRAKNAGRLFP